MTYCNTIAIVKMSSTSPLLLRSVQACVKACVINKLQRVQNAAARLGTNSPRICHITPILEDLHWLPIKYRIEFKIVLLTFKCLYGLAPQYLADLIAVAPQSRYNLRSRNATLLVSAKARCLPTLGDRAFQSAAPKLWNSLPVEIRNIQAITS